MKFTPAAATRTRTWPGAGRAGVALGQRSTSAPPIFSTTIALGMRAR